jgi:catechol 2,3-dioxygenase-like lactoylglutathione lyase family enzyme
MTTKIQSSCPHFLVRDVVAAGQYYEDRLGFRIPEYWGDPPRFAMPHRDGFIVMLNQVEQLEPYPNGEHDVWDAYFWCAGVSDLYEELLAAGADVIHGPIDRDRYAMREFAVRDLDGYMLVFAESIANI